MEVGILFKIGAVGILVSVLCQVLKHSGREEQAFLASLAGLVLVLFCILAGTVGKMQYLLGMLAQMKSYLPVDSSYLNTLLKMLGITYVGQFSAGICKDAGYSSIAGQIELFARLAVLAVSMPVLLALLETVHDFL